MPLLASQTIACVSGGHVYFIEWLHCQDITTWILSKLINFWLAIISEDIGTFYGDTKLWVATEATKCFHNKINIIKQ